MQYSIQETYSKLDIFQEIFNDKWKLKILWVLQDGDKRYKDLKHAMNSTDKTLCLKLKELESRKLIVRKHFQEIPPRVEYSSSEYSKTLKPILLELVDWCNEYEKVRKKC